MKFAVFIEGETIDLCVPNRRAIEEGWANWFNAKETTEFLGHGVFPNLREDQELFYDDLLNRKRLVLLICSKDQNLLGVISLSSLDLMNGSCQIAIVFGVRQNPKRLSQLEAMALMTQHAFEKMRMQRVWAGQAYPGLRKWNHLLEMIGYRTEGISRDGFIKGSTKTDTVQISCTWQDYLRTKEKRGALWGGNAYMMAMMRKRPTESIADKLDPYLRALQKEHSQKWNQVEDEVMMAISPGKK